MIKLIKYLKPYTVYIVVAVMFLFGQALAELYLPTLMSEVVNNGMLRGDTEYIWKYGGYMLLVALGSSACAIASSYLAAMVALGQGRDLRNMIFKRVTSFSLAEFDDFGTASLITRTTNDITQIQTLVVMGIRFFIYSPIMCIGGIWMAARKDMQMTMILIIILPIMLGLIGILASLIVPQYKQLQVKVDAVNRVLRENLTGIRVIRAFDRLESENQRFAEANRDLTDISIRVNKIMAVMQPLMILMMNLATIAIIWLGGKYIAQNTLQLGDMMAFLQYTMQIMFSIIMVTIVFVMVPRAQASAIRINEVLDRVATIVDPELPEKPSDLKGVVEFQNVSFSYPGAEEPALCNISFKAEPGETTAIIGGTGSGKSTLIHLIPRFYDVCQGTILVDGVDIRHMDQQTLRHKVGFVPQAPVLFSGTITENIAFGLKAADEEDIRKAAEVAQAAEFINSLTEGYDTVVSQGGTNFSGGQKQRLSIARALVRRPEIYIFDDSFSALDYKTDANLRNALLKETKESTVLIVAQRVSTVMNADRIIVLDNGEIAGMGTHKQLLKSCKVYQEIVSSQLSEEEIA